MITTKQLNPIQENIPDSGELEEIFEHHELLPRPLLATLQAYVKMHVYDHLINDPHLLKEDLDLLYKTYFPQTLVTLSPKDTDKHRLKNEIIYTLLTNSIINQAGTPFFFKMEQLTTRPISEIALAYLLIDKLIDGPTIKTMILESRSPCEKQYQQLLYTENIIQNIILDLLQLPNITVSLTLIKKLTPIKKILSPKTPPTTVQAKLESLKKYSELCNLFYLSQTNKINIENSLNVLSSLDEIFEFNELKNKLTSLQLSSTWDINQREILLHALKSVKQFFTQSVITTKKKTTPLSNKNILAYLNTTYPRPITLYFQSLQELKASQNIDITTIAVTINRLSSILLTKTL